MTSLSIAVPGATVHSRISGAGEAVVLLHGLGGDSRFWDGVAGRLAEDFQVVAIDLRGSGLTTTLSRDHDIADLADDVAAVLDHLGVVSAHVVGFAMGGFVAQSFAVRHASRVRRMVLAATSATLNPQLRAYLDGVLDVYESGISPRQMHNLVWPWSFAPDFIDEPSHRHYFAYTDDDPMEQSLASWRGQYLAQRRFDGAAALGTITAPSLVLAGGTDPFVPLGEATAFAKAIDAARIREYGDCGHLMALERPDRFASDVRRFLLDAG
jgi:3-oxoadipate enol-lactonase